MTLSTLTTGFMVRITSYSHLLHTNLLVGTGATIFGGRDLTKWDTVHNVTLKSLADGIEETSVQALISPPSGPNLLSGVGDIGGFVHSSLTTAPKYAYMNPHYVTIPDLDFAGLKVRLRQIY